MTREEAIEYWELFLHIKPLDTLGKAIFKQSEREE